jgi:4-hydroxybenzoate polyprenyltransferase
MRNLFAYAQLVRLPNTFTAWADILLGAVASGFLTLRCRWFAGKFEDMLPGSEGSELPGFSSEAAKWAIFVCLLAASTCFYWSGMVWNDYFDLDVDRKERPSRPIASERVSVRMALMLGVGLMAAGLGLTACADLLSEEGRWRSLPVAVALVGCIFLYDGMLKDTIFGPIAMGLCRSLNIFLGLTVVNAFPPPWGWVLALVVGVYIAGVTWFARSEAQQSNKTSLIAAAIVILVSMFLALTVPALAIEPGASVNPAGSTQPPVVYQPSILFPYLLALFGGYLGIAVLQAINRPEPERVQKAVRRAILGLIVLDALLASAFVGMPGLLLAALLLPGMILGRWFYST